jgi:xanthine dehydrogenase YagS FAD-binding subunit
VAQAAGEAATPQVRNVATVGGNLCQRSRCWYFRNADFSCLKKGGDTCPAIEGDNRYHAIFGEAKCPTVHASNLGPALVALEATVIVVGPGGARAMSSADFFATDDVKRENALKENEVVIAVEVPAGWKSAYVEVRERQSFDWPLVSVAVAVKDKDARVVLGAVAPRPWRVEAAERALAGGASGEKVAEAAIAGAKPLSHNAYKVELIKALVPRAIEAMK